MTKNYKIVHDREICIGCNACATICDKYWKMNDDGKADLIGAKKVGEFFELEIDDLECNREAAELCPVNCIHIIDLKNGKKLI